MLLRLGKPYLIADEDSSMYACICHAVTEAEVSDTIAAGATTEEEVGEACGAGTGCGSCLDRICALISERHPLHGRTPLRAAG